MGHATYVFRFLDSLENGWSGPQDADQMWLGFVFCDQSAVAMRRGARLTACKFTLLLRERPHKSDTEQRLPASDRVLLSRKTSTYKKVVNCTSSGKKPIRPTLP
ncbi:MAG: hypothetical protein JWN74_2187 [Acidobacteriaceae bacterium]|nr:hypothetical protein [Acidobacteriaceae bacterium]